MAEEGNGRPPGGADPHGHGLVSAGDDLRDHERPDVSAIMSVFNGEQYLREAVDSILAQRFANFEFIIIDDASTDGTAAILDEYTDPRLVRLRNERNRGLAVSLNRGLEVARGEFVARQDADDVSHPDRFGRQLEFFEAHPDVALVGSAHIEIDDAGGVLGRVEAHCDRVEILWAMLFYCPFAHTAVMFRRRQVVDSVGIYDPDLRYSMDYEYWSRIAAVFPVANLPEPLVQLRMHAGSMTATYGEYTREGPRLRAQAVADLLASSGAGAEDAAVCHRRLSALLLGPADAYTVEQLLDAVDTLFELQFAFVRKWDLPAAAGAAHLTGLREHVAQRLLQLARERRHHHGPAARRAAWQLVRRAVAVRPGLLVRPGAAAQIARVMLGRDRNPARAGREKDAGQHGG